MASPYATYDLLREHAPVYWSERWSAWLVTRYDDVRSVLQDHGRFSNRGRYTTYMAQLSPEQRGQLEALLEHYEHGGLVQSDPPEHTRLRRLVNQAFTPRAVATMRELVEEIVDGLLDGMAGRERVELVSEFAFPLPATVIAGMLGVPAEERELFGAWSAKIQRFLGQRRRALSLCAGGAGELGADERDFWGVVGGPAAAPTRRFGERAGAGSRRGHRAQRGRNSPHLRRDAHCRARDDDEPHRQRRPGAASASLNSLRFCAKTPPSTPRRSKSFYALIAPSRAPRVASLKTVNCNGQRLKKGDLVYVMLGAANRDPAQFD